MIREVIAAALLIGGAAFMLIAGIALVRMPDLYMRMSATTKAATLGMGLILLGMVVYSGDTWVAARALAVAVFGFLTTPVAAHMIARAGYFVGVPLWEGTIVDELKGRYDRRTHVLSGTVPSVHVDASQREAGPDAT